ncbi:MAG: hypothetical protein HY901_18050, partial [Deltaproteobacteria bacterium]|nr:hypothetical protein [Deltaproteobacteria bacterium]
MNIRASCGFLAAALLVHSGCGTGEDDRRRGHGEPGYEDRDEDASCSVRDGGFAESTGTCDLPIEMLLAQTRLRMVTAGEDFGLGEARPEMFTLLDQCDEGTLPADLTALAGLSLAEQRMTVAGAAIHLTGLQVNCAELRRLAYGEPKTILEIAQAVNVAAGSPLGAQEIAALPFERQYLVWEIARANDLGEGWNAQAHNGKGGEGGGGSKRRDAGEEDEEDDGHGKKRDGGESHEGVDAALRRDASAARPDVGAVLPPDAGKPRHHRDGGLAPGDDRVQSRPETLVSDPVKQLVVAFVGALKGRDHFPPRGNGEEGGKRWLGVTREQPLFDQLLHELGDHTPPPAPLLDPVVSPTNQNPTHVRGSAEPGTTVRVTGGVANASVEVGPGGAWLATVPLIPNAANRLAVQAVDPAGNASAARTAEIRHDGVAPILTVLEPGNGESREAITIAVRGTLADEYSVGEVRINGVPVPLVGGAFATRVVLAEGPNEIALSASDAAGNSVEAMIHVDGIRPLAFARIGPEGGRIEVSAPGPLRGASVEVPAGALTTETYLWLRLETSPGNQTLPQGVIAVGPVLSVEPDGTQFLRPVTLTVPYDPSLLAPVWGRGENLGVYTAAGVGAPFAPIAASFGAGFARANTTHLSLFEVGVDSAELRVSRVSGNAFTGVTDPWASPSDTPLEPEWVATAGTRTFVARRSAFGADTEVYEQTGNLVPVATVPVAEPAGLIVGPTGRVFLGDRLGGRIWEVTPGATPGVVVGGGALSPWLGVSGTQAWLWTIEGITMNRATGAVYIVDACYRYAWDPVGDVVRVIDAFGLVCQPWASPPVYEVEACERGSPSVLARPVITTSPPAAQSVTAGSILFQFLNGELYGLND